MVDQNLLFRKEVLMLEGTNISFKFVDDSDIEVYLYFDFSLEV